MKKIITLLLCVVIGLSLALAWLHTIPYSSSDIELRAAMDIGSGATNMKIAKVNPHTDKIISIIFEQSIPVAYQKQLEQTGDDLFNRETMDQGIKAIKVLKASADSYKVKKIVAVATAAFRQAKNNQSFVKEIKQQTGVDVKVISQDEEGFLAFRAALAKVPTPADQAVVWDIGGGSLQMTFQKKDGQYVVAKGATASAPFKNSIIEKVQGKDPTKVHSPNPMNKEQMQQAIQMAGMIAIQSIDPDVQSKIKEKGTEVLAVGNLFNYGIRSLVDGNPVATQYQLEKATEKMEGKSDSEISKDAFADVAVSNSLMVIGFMKALDIEKVTILDVNNADGALTYAPFWS